MGQPFYPYKAILDRVRTGLVNATRPYSYDLDVQRVAMNETDHMEETSFAGVLYDKGSRIARGLLGSQDDYVDQMTTHFMDKMAEFYPDLGQGRSAKAVLQGDYDITDLVSAVEDRKDAATDVAEARTDLLTLGLGGKQRYGHFVDSKHRPSKGETDSTSEYIDFKEDSVFKEGTSATTGGLTARQLRAGVLGSHTEGSPDIPGTGYDGVNIPDPIKAEDDYESYYDRWDFITPGKTDLGPINTILEGTGLYTPQEVYGRLYNQRR